MTEENAMRDKAIQRKRKMNEKDKKRARAAEIRRKIQERRAARSGHGRMTKVKGDLLEQVKEKMAMRIYGVSHEKAKEMVAKRAAESAAREAENKAKPSSKSAKTYRRDCSADDEWIPMEDIIGMEVGESDD